MLVVVDGARAGTYQQLFHSVMQIVGKECVMVDLEPTVADCARVGAYHQFFHPEELIVGKGCVGSILSPLP